MEAVREKWTDERLGDLSQRVDRGFEAVERRFEAIDRRFEAVDRRFEAMERRFERVDERLDSMTRVMTQGFVATGAAMITGFLALAGLIVAYG